MPVSGPAVFVSPSAKREPPFIFPSWFFHRFPQRVRTIPQKYLTQSEYGATMFYVPLASPAVFQLPLHSCHGRLHPSTWLLQESTSVSFHGTYDPFVFILLRTFLPYPNRYPQSFQRFPHSCRKTPGVGYTSLADCVLVPQSPDSSRPALRSGTDFSLCASRETTEAPPVAHPQRFPTPETSPAAARAPALSPLSKC